jgi:hypothetical protein
VRIRYSLFAFTGCYTSAMKVPHLGCPFAIATYEIHPLTYPLRMEFRSLTPQISEPVGAFRIHGMGWVLRNLLAFCTDNWTKTLIQPTPHPTMIERGLFENLTWQNEVILHRISRGFQILKLGSAPGKHIVKVSSRKPARLLTTSLAVLDLTFSAILWMKCSTSLGSVDNAI